MILKLLALLRTLRAGSYIQIVVPVTPVLKLGIIIGDGYNPALMLPVVDRAELKTSIFANKMNGKVNPVGQGVPLGVTVRSVKNLYLLVSKLGD